MGTSLAFYIFFFSFFVYTKYFYLFPTFFFCINAFAQRPETENDVESEHAAKTQNSQFVESLVLALWVVSHDGNAFKTFFHFEHFRMLVEGNKI